MTTSYCLYILTAACISCIPQLPIFRISIVFFNNAIMDIQNYPEALYPFVENIVIQDRASAIQYGHDIFAKGTIDRTLVIWVDGSVQRYPQYRRSKRTVVSAIRYLDPLSENWRELVTFNTLPYGSNFSFEAEMIAIHEAFRVACDLVDSFDHLLIFTDSQTVQHHLKGRLTFSFLSKRAWLTNLFKFANLLYDDEISAEFRWVPAHSGGEGNEKVDELAKNFRRTLQAILAKDRLFLTVESLSYVPDPIEMLRHVVMEKVVQTKHDKGQVYASEVVDTMELDMRNERTDRLKQLLQLSNYISDLHPEPSSLDTAPRQHTRKSTMQRTRASLQPSSSAEHRQERAWTEERLARKTWKRERGLPHTSRGPKRSSVA